MYSNSTFSITVTPATYCAEQYLKAYGYIVEIYDFTQKNSLIRYLIPTHKYILSIILHCSVVSIDHSFFFCNEYLY